MFGSFTGSFKFGRRKKISVALGILYSFTSFTFTNASRTGRAGPTLAQCKSAYDTATHTWINDTAYFNVVTQGIQLWTVPETATYRIVAAGAQGSSPTNAGGRGAIMQGDFSLTAGDKIQIAVGQQSTFSTNRAPGGGGSWVVRYTSASNPSNNVEADILVIAGGGGGTGGGTVDASCHGQTTTASGQAYRTGVGNWGGTAATAGAGGNAGNASVNGAGGGFLTNGQNGSGGTRGNDLAGGHSWLNGVLGGAINVTYSPNGGGFGGGGSPNNGNFSRYAGGGGYSGGASTDTGTANNVNDPGFSGGGGGSINNGANQVNAGGATNGRAGAGYVTITKL